MEAGRSNNQQPHSQHKPLLFNPTQPRKLKHKEQPLHSPTHTLYTAPFHSQTTSTISIPTAPSKILGSTQFAHFVNPRPNRLMRSDEKEDKGAVGMNEGSVGRYESLEKRVRVLRRTVSQNKAIA
jgi:hypothetical protein